LFVLGLELHSSSSKVFFFLLVVTIPHGNRHLEQSLYLAKVYSLKDHLVLEQIIRFNWYQRFQSASIDARAKSSFTLVSIKSHALRWNVAFVLSVFHFFLLMFSTTIFFFYSIQKSPESLPPSNQSPKNHIVIARKISLNYLS